jgi:hypothetical protein
VFGGFMKKYCLECWNETHGCIDKPRRFIFSREPELCEICGQYKRVIIRMRRYYYIRALDILLIPLKIPIMPFYLVYKEIEYQYQKKKNKKESQD